MNLIFLSIFLLCVPAVAHSGESATVVNYEAFGAVGDGKTNDLPAICKAHEHANKNYLRVRTNPKATYHLGTKALTALIQTDTDWGHRSSPSMTAWVWRTMSARCLNLNSDFELWP